MEERTQFYFINLREGTFNNVQYQRLDFIDDAGNKYSVSCSATMAEIITAMDIPKFAPIAIGFSVVPTYGKMKISIDDIDVLN